MSLADLKKSMAARREAQAPPETPEMTLSIVGGGVATVNGSFQYAPDTTGAIQEQATTSILAQAPPAQVGMMTMMPTAPGAFTTDDLNIPHNIRNGLVGYRSLAQAPPNASTNVIEFPQGTPSTVSTPVGLDAQRSAESASLENMKKLENSGINSGGTESLVFHTAPGAFTPVSVLLGPGGTGKTYRIRQYAEQNEEQRILLTATTGVAAINIGPGCVTVNSAFKFFDEASLRDALAYRPQIIQREISGNDIVVVDEVSMLSSGILELLYGFIERLNREGGRRRPLKLLLSGDFCQLPPVTSDRTPGGRSPSTPFAFKASCWESAFQPAITKLTRNYRQENDQKFQQALYYARIGNAGACVANLDCEYSTTVDMDFKGLTLYPVNKDVNDHNQRKLMAIQSPDIEDAPIRWGEQHRDWKEIPDKFIIRLGAQARITANRTPSFEYVNGDIGTLLAYAPGSYARVRLHRPPATGESGEVVVDLVTRWNPKSLAKDEEPPKDCNGHKVPFKKDKSEFDSGGAPGAWYIEWKQKYDAYVAAMERLKINWYDPKSNKWIVGGITYLPIALGWASTYHRAQGLTVDSVQIDINNKFCDSPQMMYVALSRARKAENIRITRGGSSPQSKLASRIRAHPEVLRFV